MSFYKDENNSPFNEWRGKACWKGHLALPLMSHGCKQPSLTLSMEAKKNVHGLSLAVEALHMFIRLLFFRCSSSKWIMWKWGWQGCMEWWCPLSSDNCMVQNSVHSIQWFEATLRWSVTESVFKAFPQQNGYLHPTSHLWFSFLTSANLEQFSGTM